MHRLRGQLGLWIVTAAFIVFAHSSCPATTIVAIRTPELFIIAADGKSTFKGSGSPPTWRSVSKVFQEGRVLWAISGLTKDVERGFNPAETIAAFVQNSPSFLNELTNLEAILSKSLKEELAKLRIEEPLLFRDSIEGDNAGTSILFACFEKEEPVAIAVQFLGAVDPDGQLVIKKTRLACPADCSGGTYTFFLGHHKAIDKYVTEHGKHFAMSPEESVKFMVQLEIDAKTPGVGPPIDVVRLDKNGVEWLSANGQSEQ